ncbi:ABC transporter substrate-binding protein [Lacticaseibacillus jixianensis]|uniref:ABC transporter substrate-binding protein n=1 Tax=Lacticaseibacillus jixianensis TaxID=2486012 RepID=A0ABW4B7W5_9LACO|nr:ABC transporter substrate-binding protein [Lacticaseibacillus jixianensis]
MNTMNFRSKVSGGLKKAALVTTVAAAALALAACGSSNSSSNKAEKDDGKLMTVTVYDDMANYQGVAKGWFAHYVQKKFNIKLKMVAPNVSGGGNTLFDTRTAAGNLGDLIITGTNHVNKLTKAGLLTNMTPYMSGMKYIKKYSAATDQITKLAGKKGIWGITNSVSSESPTKSSEGLEPITAPYIRWDLYKKVGYPKLNSTDDLLNALKDMQTEARKETGKNDVYAISLFKDWDSTMMQNAGQNLAFYGWEVNQPFALSKGNGSAYESLIDSKSQYVKGLRFLNKAKQLGLVDPESTTQNWDTMYSKYQAGKVLFAYWGYLGQGAFNTTSNMAAGKGFELAPLKNMKVFSMGNQPTGNTTFIGVGSKAKNKARLVKFINWLYSPEGVQIQQAQTTGYSAGPKGLTWKMKGGQPVLTEFGKKAQLEGGSVQVPAKWGTGTWKDGISTLNYVAVMQYDKDPTTGYSYGYVTWPSVLKLNQTKLSKDWSAHMDNATSSMDYLKKNKELLVGAGVSYTAPEDSSTVSTTRGSIGTQIVNSSWKMVMAKNDAEFNSLLSNMQKTAKGLGYDSVYKVDLKNAKAKNALREKTIKQYKEDK